MVSSTTTTAGPLPFCQAPTPAEAAALACAHLSRASSLGGTSISLIHWRVAVLGSDSNNDTFPSVAEGVDFPVHVLAVNAMGLHLLDWLQLDDLAEFCEEANRWSFCCVIAPLRLVRGTGSPVNPIAIL